MLIWLSERNDVRAAETKVIASARISAANVKLLVETTLDRLARIDDQLGTDPTQFRLPPLPDGQNFVGLYNAAGDTINADGTLGASVTSNPEFQALAAGKPWTITPLIGGSNSPIRLFGIAKRIDREGEFGGVITAFFPADQLSEVWSSLALGPDSTVGLFRDDGEMVTRYPVPDQSINLKTYELFTDHLPLAPSGSYQAVSPIDGHARTVGYESLGALGLVVVASMAQTATEDAFWSRVRSTSLVAAPIFFALLLLCGWATLLLLRHARSREELQAALAQNRVLFQEIHHRVKNNLQAVTAMVRLQAGPADLKEDLTRRIAAMSAVHQHIYESDQFGDVDASAYLGKLLAGLKESAPPGVALDWKLDPLEVSADQALPLGLLVNELVSNAFKHAFPNGRPGKVDVRLERATKNEAMLTVSDDGAGQGATTPGNGGGFGGRLITGFVGQLHGDSKTRTAGGVTFELRFPLEA